MFLDYFALFMLFFVVIVLFYGVIVIHDIPYEIAVHRNHPHQDAIHVAGWVSLFTLHVLWPFLWIWATLWREDRGWGMNSSGMGSSSGDNLGVISSEVLKQQQQIEALQAELSLLRAETSGSPDSGSNGDEQDSAGGNN